LTAQISIKSLTDAQIAEAITARDESVYMAFYDQYSSELYYFIQARGCYKELADEVLQDVFLKVWEKIGSYDSSKASLRTWIYRITRNATIDALRSAGEKRSAATGSLENTVHTDRNAHSFTNTTDHGLKKVLSYLDEDSQKVIDLLYFQGYSQRDAQKELDMPLGTLKSKVRRAMTKLRDILNNEKQHLRE